MSTLSVESVALSYGDSQALWDVSFSVEQGSFVSLLGANGAGKTTTLKAISGLLPLKGGTVRYGDRVITGLRADQVADLGLTLVPEGRQLFPKMTVEENLILGSYLKRAKRSRKENLKKVYELFPRLDERRHQLAETLSGGEQQMVAIGRGLMQEPKIVMFDEPSLGLAPILVQDIFKAISELHRLGMTIFLVEQNARRALAVADRAYVLELGRVRHEGTGRELLDNPDVQRAYLGV